MGKLNSLENLISLLEKIYNYLIGKKALCAFLISILSFLGFFLSPLKELAYEHIWPTKIEIVLKSQNKDIFIDEELLVNVQLNKISGRSLPRGVLTLEFDDEFIQLNAGTANSIQIDEFSGSRQATMDKIIFKPKKLTTQGTNIYAKFKSGKMLFTSNKLEINIKQAPHRTSPRIESSDTNRINLSGRWDISIGADHGYMEIKQGTDNKINGKYFLDGSKWRNGEIKGFKDGLTFLVFFVIDNNDRERLRVSGKFKINEADRSYIEITGCAYQILKDSSVLTDSGSEAAGDCTKTKNYFGWRGKATTTFYAMSTIQIQPVQR